MAGEPHHLATSVQCNLDFLNLSNKRCVNKKKEEAVHKSIKNWKHFKIERHSVASHNIRLFKFLYWECSYFG